MNGVLKVSLTIRIEAGTGLAIATATGVLNRGDAQESTRALWNTPGWNGKAVVWDFREGEFDLSAEEIRGIARYVLDHQPKESPAKVAFVVKRDVDFGMARMFEVYRDQPGTEFRVFRNCEEALNWARELESAGA